MNLLQQTLELRDCLSIGYFLASIAVSYNGEFRVDFGGCYLGDAGIKFLMQSLSRGLSMNPYRKITGHLSINLNSNAITEGVVCIAEVLQNTRALRKLELSYNSIGGNGLQSISEALIHNTSLVKLDLRRCSLRITEENGPILTEMLQKNKTLRELDLSSNFAVSNSQAHFIIEGLKYNNTLKSLSLAGCNIIGATYNTIQNCTSTCNVCLSWP